MSRAAANRALVESAYASFFRGDAAGFLAAFDESSVMVEPDALPYGGSFRGLAEIGAALGKLAQAWTDLRYDIVEVVAGERIAIAYGLFSAAAKSSGTRVSFPIAEVWTLDNGRVVELRPIYADVEAARRALA